MSLLNYLKVPFFLARWSKRALTIASSNYVPPLKDQKLRFNSNARANCKPVKQKCGETLKNKPCLLKRPKTIIKQPAPMAIPAQKRSIKINRPDICCGEPCPDALPRFDQLYYKRTDKLSRDYQQTWAECPDLVKKPKLICYFEKIKLPKMKKRSKEARQMACMDVCAAVAAKCPRIKAPHCRRGRMPPKCHRIRDPIECEKPKVPSPAFSECKRKPAKSLHPIECRCLLTPAICEVWAHYYKMKKVRKIDSC